MPHPGAVPGREESPEAGDVVARFTSAFQAAGGEVARLGDAAAARRWMMNFVGGFTSVATAPGLPGSWRLPLEEALPEEASLGVSRAVGAAADTGTLLLDGGEGRALQLLPPVHLIWLEERRLRPTLDSALETARADGLPRALALHSGPSKSADIGQILVTGVHGPGRVVVAVVADGGPGETEPRPDS